MCPDVDPTNYSDWVHSAIEEHQRRSLCGIVLTKQLLESFGPLEILQDLSSVLDSTAWLERRHSKRVRMALPEYQQEICGLIGYSQTVTLIDPYLNPDRPKFLDVVKLCAAMLGCRRVQNSIKRVHIHASVESLYPSEIDALIARWRASLQPLVAQDNRLHFKVSLWSDFSCSDDDVHDRFIISDQFAVSIPRGLDMRSKSVIWAALEEEERQSLLQQYSSAGTFRLADSVELRYIE
jgi:hypothetical protein